ncbi:MAG: Cof-type HAD-IIB family hydrolase [Enterococcus avium]
MYQSIVFFDLDGTLLNSKNALSKDVVEAIRRLKENNVLPVIATGRSIEESQLALTTCGIDSIIAMNGSLTVHKNEILDRKAISKEVCYKLHRETKKVKASLAFFSESLAWCTDHSVALSTTFKRLSLPLPELHTCPYLDNPILSMVMCSENIDDRFLENFPELTFYKVTPSSFDIVRSGTNKGSGVEKFLKRFSGIKTFAFGDGVNDLSLFEKCDIGIAMENGVSELKAEADFITSHHDKGGIIQGLTHYELI